MVLFMILLGILVGILYLTLVFMTAWVIYRQSDCENFGCWCQNEPEMHYLPAAVGGIGWPIYWLYRLGRALPDFKYAAWKEQRIERRHAATVAAIRRQTEKARAQRELLDEQTGIAHAERIITS